MGGASCVRFRGSESDTGLACNAPAFYSHLGRTNAKARSECSRRRVAGKGAVEQDSPGEETNMSETGQLGHRNQDSSMDPATAIFQSRVRTRNTAASHILTAKGRAHDRCLIIRTSFPTSLVDEFVHHALGDENTEAAGAHSFLISHLKVPGSIALRIADGSV